MDPEAPVRRLGTGRLNALDGRLTAGWLRALTGARKIRPVFDREENDLEENERLSDARRLS